MSRFLFIFPAILLAACSKQGGDAVERIALEDVRTGPSQPLPSPDTEGAEWQPLDGAHSIRFGKPGDPPLLTIACELRGKASPLLHITRYARADPGAKALFALLGQKHNSRLNIDAKREGMGWLWASALPADDPLLDIFAETGTIEATLPGAGTLELAPSDQPARLLAWCRRSVPEPARTGDAPQPALPE